MSNYHNYGPRLCPNENVSNQFHVSPNPSPCHDRTPPNYNLNNEVSPDQENTPDSEQIFRCLFCRTNQHLSMNCHRIGSASALRIARNERLCFICLTPGHSAFFCPCEISCGNSICMSKAKPSHGNLLCPAFQNSHTRNPPPLFVKLNQNPHPYQL